MTSILVLGLLQGSRDNMSIIIIAFPGAPKICNEAIRRENELNETLQQKVLGRRVFSFSDDYYCSTYFLQISSMSLTPISTFTQPFKR